MWSEPIDLVWSLWDWRSYSYMYWGSKQVRIDLTISYSGSNIAFSIFNSVPTFFRNRSVGLRIGKGEKLDDITKSMSAVAEGVLTTRSAHLLAKKVGIECHVIEGIYKVRIANLYSVRVS